MISVAHGVFTLQLSSKFFLVQTSSCEAVTRSDDVLSTMAANIMVFFARRRSVVIFGLLIVFLPSIYAGTNRYNKKLSYRRETARQLPTRKGLSPPVHSPSPSGYTYAYGRIRNLQQTYVKRAVRKAHFKVNRAFKVIQGYPYLCRQEPRVVYCRNVQLMPPLFLKLTKIMQQGHSKFVDFNDPTQVWRRPSKKRLRISTNNYLYCQKLESLAYIFAADSVGSFISFHVIMLQSRTLWI